MYFVYCCKERCEQKEHLYPSHQKSPKHKYWRFYTKPYQLTSHHCYMDEDDAALVLARASELRSKITNCIQNASSTPDDDAEEADSLLDIRESLEALEVYMMDLYT
ncbi:hypothetical protein Hdeb2414_s0012g00389581 [Helianthus debilis subsp. tardiflorus]